jgi:hypothetical protein
MVNFFVTNPKSATGLQNLLIAYCWSLGDSHWIRGRRNLRPSMTSICYIVPSYTPNEASHMAHLPRFLSEVGKYCDLHVIIQRGREQPKIPDVRSVYVQRPGNHFQRAVELIQVAYRLRQQGCCKFFVASRFRGFRAGACRSGPGVADLLLGKWTRKRYETALA